MNELKPEVQFEIIDHPTKKMNTVVKDGERVGVYVVESVESDKVIVRKLLGNGLKNVMGETEISKEDVETYGVILQESEYVQRKLPSTLTSLVKLLESGFVVKTDEQREHIKSVIEPEIQKVSSKINELETTKKMIEEFLTR